MILLPANSVLFVKANKVPFLSSILCRYRYNALERRFITTMIKVLLQKLMLQGETTMGLNYS